MTSSNLGHSERRDPHVLAVIACRLVMRISEATFIGGCVIPVIGATAGALAFKRSGDPNMGNFADATILKSFGEVPANLDEL